MPGRTGRYAGPGALGLLAGLASGLLGIGGGVVLVPGLQRTLRMGQKEAVANSLLAIIPISIVGVVAYWFLGSSHQVRLVLGLFLSLGSIIGARVGAEVAHRAPDRGLRLAFGILVILVAVRLLLPGLPAPGGHHPTLAREAAVGILTGLVAGAISGALGIGGGVVMVPAMVLLLGISQAAAQGTSLLVILPTALSGVQAHYRNGYLKERLTFVVGFGGALSAGVGALVALHTDNETLRRVFAIYLLYVGAQAIFRGPRPRLHPTST
ncbi:MAG: sulfite exporter TauE/SafE family protein [Candidatus Dormibacteria bacterium]